MLSEIKKAQSILEYALLIGILVAALLYMQNYLKRSIQGRLQDAVDQIGDQYSSTVMYRREFTESIIPYQSEDTSWHWGSLTTTRIEDASQETIAKRVMGPLDHDRWTSTGN